MERPKQKLTTKLKTKVKEISEVGNQHDENALTLETTDQIKHKCRPKKFAFKDAGADDEVMEALFEMAKSGKNTTAAIFWAKARCGMHEKGREKKQQVSQAPTIVIRTEEGKKA
jgi:hypothetical protein